jgi:hypothetical protein
MEWWFHNYLTISNRILDASVLIGCNSTNMNDDDEIIGGGTKGGFIIPISTYCEL